MSSASGDQPTRVLPPTADQPAPTTEAPPPARFWRQQVPARIGRARTSTVVLGVLFVACFGLYLGVRPPAVEYTTIETTSGETYRVPVTARVPAPEPTEPAAPTSEVPEPAAPTGTTAPPASATTTAPGRTSPQPEGTTSSEPTSTRPPTSTRAPGTDQAPATTEEDADTATPAGTPTPTG